MPPLVSVCIPVRNGGDLVVRAIQSALDQDHRDLEVVVVDDASTDDTPARLRERFGGRISVFINPRRCGQTRTANATIARSHGAYVKFLHHDDWLKPRCVSRMAAALDEHPSAGMVFSRRQIEVAGPREHAEAWLGRYGEVHRGFPELSRANSGLELLRQLLDDGLHNNWVGEPSCVMVRRDALDAVGGGFNSRTYGAVDLELWARLMARCDVVFLDEELVTYRHAARSTTSQTRSAGFDWLDRLWTLEALGREPSLRGVFPRLEHCVRAERRMAFRTVARYALSRREGTPRLRLWFGYLGWRAGRAIAEPDLYRPSPAT